MTTKRITGRISLTALRKAIKRARKVMKTTICVTVELWDHAHDIQSEEITLWAKSQHKAQSFYSINELNDFLDKCEKALAD